MQLSEEEARTEAGYSDFEWQQLMKGLDEKYQLVAMLYYGQSYSIKEISRILGMNKNTVTTRLSRARQLLKKELDIDTGVSPHPWRENINERRIYNYDN